MDLSNGRDAAVNHAAERISCHGDVSGGQRGGKCQVMSPPPRRVNLPIPSPPRHEMGSHYPALRRDASKNGSPPYQQPIRRREDVKNWSTLTHLPWRHQSNFLNGSYSYLSSFLTLIITSPSLNFILRSCKDSGVTDNSPSIRGEKCC
ncbi:hypothetical protein Bbelb_090800 [Branchiostoma belcheri]|nr:hypothetical protein Bbelb_090800 [Branchiostoma belcheri]